MSDTLIVEKDNIQVVQINETEILVIEKGFSIINTGGGSSEWGGITGNLADQTDLKNALDNKVDKVTGKGLSTNDYTDLEKQNLSNTSGTNTGDETLASIKSKLGISTLSGSNTGDQTITLTGDVTGSGTGSFATTLANSGVTVGTYKSVTVDSKGRVIAGANPTTLSGYGITDADTSAQVTTKINNAVAALVDASPTTLDTLNELAAALGDDPNFATTTSTALGNRVVKNADIVAGTGTKITYDAKGLVTSSTTPTTLAGYSIGDAYTKAEADALHDSLAVASAGQSVSYFLDNVIKPGGNYALTNSPDGDPETTIAKIAVAANTPYFMERYISDPIGGTKIDGGLWVFRTYARVSSDVGTSEIVSRINKRTIKSGTVTITGTGTSRTITSSDPIFVLEDANSSILNATLIETPTETFWISAFTSATQVTAITDNSGYINETSVSIHMYYKLFEATTGDINGNTAKLYETKSIQPSFNIVPTDSILIAYFAITTSTNKTLTLYKGGTVNYSHIVTPIVYRHNSLKGLNEGEFQHLTTAQLSKINAISGTNTGDETQTSINSKIGYTPANDSDVVHKTGTETINGAKTFTNGINVGGGTTSNFSTIIATSNVRIGGQSINHSFGGIGIVNYNFQNSTTGSTSNDGLTIGISSIGVAQIIQKEDLNLEFYTNNVKVGNISNTGVWANNNGTWNTLSDERLKENIKPVSNALDKCLAIAECVRQYTFKNQIKYASGQRTGYIAQLLRDKGFEDHVTINNPVDEEEGVLLGWEYADEMYIDEEGVEQTRRIIVKEGDKILGIENNFTPYLFAGFKELNNRLKNLEERLSNL